MATVTFILGLCGSGKSHLADEMAREGTKEFDEGFIAPESFERNVRELTATLRGGGDSVVVEINFCYQQTRDEFVRFLRAQVPDVRVEWIAFENDLAAANENCRRRVNKGDTEGHIKINNRMSPDYVIPNGVTPRSIYRLSEDGR